jgi:YaiO family outer membrane protein
MSLKRQLGLWIAIVLISGPLFFLPSPAQAQSQTDNHVEFEVAHSELSNGYADWNDVNILNYFLWRHEQFVIETDYKSHFEASAVVIGITDTHTYNPLWYQDFSLSYATNNAILPGYVLYTELHRKFLRDESLVGGIGVGHNVNESPYSDTYGLMEATYYLGGPISLQAGMRLNNSSPGDVFTTRYFGNVNFLYDRFDGYLRYETGREGYTVIGENEFENKFSSHEEEALLHYWYTARQGVGLRIDFYESDVYNRNEIALQWLLKY